MSDVQELVMSIHPIHAESILAGKKTVELRRRAPRVPDGSLIWFYATLPAGEIVLRARLRSIFCGAPSTIWRKFSKDVAITKTEFDRYFYGKEIGAALILESVKGLPEPVGLEELRSCRPFQPPQYFSKLGGSDKIRGILAAATG